MKKNYWYALLMGFVMLSCAEPPAPQGYQVAQPDANPSYQGFYVLNEGTMGANKATLDNFNYTTGYFENDIFPKRNPSIIGELGDVVQVSVVLKEEGIPAVEYAQRVVERAARHAIFTEVRQRGVVLLVYVGREDIEQGVCRLPFDELAGDFFMRCGGRARAGGVCNVNIFQRLGIGI